MQTDTLSKWRLKVIKEAICDASPRNPIYWPDTLSRSISPDFYLYYFLIYVSPFSTNLYSNHMQSRRRVSALYSYFSSISRGVASFLQPLFCRVSNGIKIPLRGQFHELWFSLFESIKEIMTYSWYKFQSGFAERITKSQRNRFEFLYTCGKYMRDMHSWRDSRTRLSRRKKNTCSRDLFETTLVSFLFFRGGKNITWITIPLR